MNKPLVLWGGTDISPSIYKQTSLKYTQQSNTLRDERETEAVMNAIKNNIPVIGVCRGAQLLCALNGGTLFQHSIPNEQCHSIKTLDGHIFERVTAGHHQVMNPKGTFILYGKNPNFIRVWKTNDESYMVVNTAEVVWYPKTKCLAIQPHPECAPKGEAFVPWLNALIHKLNIDYSF